MDIKNNLTRIGVFYDGNYFYHISNYYNYIHQKRNRINIHGLHEFIRAKVAELDTNGHSLRHSQIVDVHFFRGRLNARDASEKENLLYHERVFDDILMSEGVTTHYLPIKSNFGKYTEKGIDVWLALEAYEMAIYKKFDVIVLIASDGDFVPLVRKLNTLGVRVMLLSWDFEYVDDQGTLHETRTSQDLLEEVTYPIPMHATIDDRTNLDDMYVQNLFSVPIPKKSPNTNGFQASEEDDNLPIEHEDGTEESVIMNLNNGFGFIRKPPFNVFFHYTNLQNTEFQELREGDRVRYKTETNEEGKEVATEIFTV